MQESFASSAKAAIIGQRNALLTKTVYAVGKLVTAVVKVGIDTGRDGSNPDHWRNYPERMRLESMEEELPKLKTWEPSKECLRAVQSEDFAQMADLLQRRFALGTQYFSRMWTVQEAIANLMVVIQRSGVQMILDRLIQTVHYLNQTQVMDQVFVDKTTRLWLIIATFQSGMKLPLRQLLFECRSMLCWGL